MEVLSRCMKTRGNRLFLEERLYRLCAEMNTHIVSFFISPPIDPRDECYQFHLTSGGSEAQRVYATFEGSQS